MTTALLVGGGHAHVALLRRLARTPVAGLRLVLVTPVPTSLYSGLLPAVIRRERTLDGAGVDLASLAARADATMSVGRLVALDPVARVAMLTSGEVVGFDVASLDPGGVSATDPDEIPAKPIAGLLEHIARIEQGQAGAVAIRGGGPAAVELALALAFRWGGERPLRLASTPLLPDAPATARRRLTEALDRLQVLRAPGPAVATIASGRTLGPAWLARSGLDCDAAGCVRTDPALRSISHPWILAAGDAASVEGQARPKGGVWAVRAGPVLAATLAAIAAGRPAPTVTPQRRALTIVGLGDGRAVGWRGNLTLTGRLPFVVKDLLDRRWLAG